MCKWLGMLFYKIHAEDMNITNKTLHQYGHLFLENDSLDFDKTVK